MKERKLYLIWLYLFILCAALGFIRQRSPLVTALLALLSVVFFLPGALLLHRGERKPVMLISAASLALTMVLFIANTLTVLAPDNILLGNIFNALLVVFSAPMMCAPYQAVSLFCWACLFFAGLTQNKKVK